MQEARFVRDWHDVPAGTEVKVIRVSHDLDGTEIALVERLDGGKLPTNYGEDTVARVSSDFIKLSGKTA